MAPNRLSCLHKFIRQQWRMWIETQTDREVCKRADEFIRQQWRMWIETVVAQHPQMNL